MRRDGYIVPFATFDGRRWGNSWPPPKPDPQVPINLESVPKAWWGSTAASRDWQVWPLSAPDAPQTVHVTQLDWVEAHCYRQIALRSDYRSDDVVPPRAEQPYPKDGLAIASSQALQPIEIVPAYGAAPRLASAGLRHRFNIAERETAGAFGHPIPRKVRENVDPIVEAVYAFGQSPRTYYVEASRLYRKLGDDGCTSIAFATGWLIDDGHRSKWADMAVDLLPCSKYGATYMLPLGVFRIGERLFWAAQYSGWDHERYVIVELKRDKVEAVVNAWGGGC